MELHPEARKLIQRHDQLAPTRATLAERQRIIETLAEQYGIWCGPEHGIHY